MDPMTARARELWDLYKDAPKGARVQQTLRAYILPYDELLAYLPDGDSLLDIGCGVGAFASLAGLRKPYSKIVGVDRERAIVVARGVADEARFTFIAGDDFREWPADQFDCVSVIDVMHHVGPDYQDAFLSALLARIAPGGRLIYKDMADDPLPALVNRAHDLVSAREWIHYYPIERASDAIVAAGLKITHAETITRGPYHHELLIADRPRA
jgi:cyclopropane fatty-acyl-phospholipid synthase-like methyltransferase